MKNQEDLAQTAGDNSTNYQAKGNISISGLTYTEAKQVALDVFNANFYRLASEASKTATTRAEEITEKFLSKLLKENPQGIALAKDPDFQYSCFEMQKAYVKTGDKDLQDLLIDLMVDRSRREQRDILQIVLNEALQTAPKLTNNQCAALAVIFFFKYTQLLNITSYHNLIIAINKHLSYFIDLLRTNDMEYQHLEFTGCGSITMYVSSIEEILSNKYQGIFNHGFEKSLLKKNGITISADSQIFCEINCYSSFSNLFNEPSKIRIAAQNIEELEKLFDLHNIPHVDRDKITTLFNSYKFSTEDVRGKCINTNPELRRLFDIWSTSQLRAFTLTSVGMAIGHASIQRYIGKFADLSIWIN